jgi:hypothetical protein
MLLTKVCHVVAGDHSSLLEGAHLPHLLDLLHIKNSYLCTYDLYTTPTRPPLILPIRLRPLRTGWVGGGEAVP